MLRCHRLGLCLPVLLGLSVWSYAETASAALTCFVAVDPDPVSAGANLAACVTYFNAGFFDHIDLPTYVEQDYVLSQPLVFTRSGSLHGENQRLLPSPEFAGDDLVIVGPVCPEGGCGSLTKMTLSSLQLEDKSATGVRGIRVRGEGLAVLDDVQVSGFDILGDGAAVYVEPDGQALLRESRMIDNHADVGGAIYVDAGALSLHNSKFLLNGAAHGGAIGLGSGGSLDIRDSNFYDNVAAGSGGVIYELPGATGTSVSIVSSTFYDNEAGNDGGAWFGGGVVEDSSFSHNVAGGWGGAAYLGPYSHVLDSRFVGNEANRGGGVAVVIGGPHDMLIEGSTFEGNVADGSFASGGGLYVNRSVANPGATWVTNCTFSGNASTGAAATFGGGFGLGMVRATLAHVTFFGNAATHGGAIHTTSSATTDLRLESSIMAGSPAGACVITSSVTEDTSLDDDGTCGVTYPSTDPQLGPLADNGGPTKTHLPAAAAVLGAATCRAAVDQRGVARPLSGCDIGSVQQ